ncbi:helix-turn-helix domain-containing protein [Mycobacterium simiae]|uniref:Helix-turn-helix domain-containing protein n=1 Tax=Mycobacterium simiae TaxID=1784 RepID=A0A5B1BLU4_MYCSI|nr:excisionase family DNA-binding protein [Mycobacterium simiae]KAA1248194.1 helix-turn-helix domain-containing protein [Mycobacterium simiae]
MPRKRFHVVKSANIPANRRERRQPEPLIGLPEVAIQAGVHYRTARRWVKNGQLAATRVGPKLLKVKQSDLDKFLTSVGGA